MKKVHYDALILGGGPSGCSCALWLRHLGLKPLIVEKTDRLGGLQNNSPYPNVWILGKNYPNGKAFAREVSKQIQGEKIPLRLKTEIVDLKFDKTEKKFKITLKKGKTISSVEASYFVLSTGVVPNSGGFQSSSQILIGPGDSIERADYNKKTVAILGGGDNAFENYQFIKRKKPRSIKIFARHVRAQLPFVKKIKRGDLKIGNYTVDIKERKVEGQNFDFIIVMYGWQAINPLQSLVSLKTKNSFIETDEYRRTSHKNIYAIGEVTQTSHPCCVTAMADGIIAAKDIQKRIDVERVSIELKLKF